MDSRDSYLDFSTIDQGAYQALPEARIAGHIGSGRGQGCFLDAPGYPSYFVQPVYDRRGDTPSRGSSVVLVIGDSVREMQTKEGTTGSNWDARHAQYPARLRALWAPLPLESERVQGWIRKAYGYFGPAWENPNVPEDRRRNADQLTMARACPGPGYIFHPLAYVRGFYPAFTGTLADGRDARLAPAYGVGAAEGIGDWLYTLAERPEDEAACRRTMPGHLAGSHGGPLRGYVPQGRYGARRLTDTVIGTRGCQWCGLASVVDQGSGACVPHHCLGCNVCDGTAEVFVPQG